MNRARRRTARGWRRRARRALLAASLWLAGLSGAGIAAAEGQVSGTNCAHPAGPPGSAMAETDRGPIRAAWFAGATTRYAHGVLGDAIEAAGLVIREETGSGPRCRVVWLDETRVFEDLSPRLADLDGDGRAEVIVVASHRDLGARLEVYAAPVGQTGLILQANTPYIGQAHRWLAPIGVADLDGDGAIELAYVDRPHLARVIRVWRFGEGQLRHLADLQGYTNHAIGDDWISGGIRHCAGAPPEMIVSDPGWRHLHAIRWDGRGFRTQRLGPHRGPGAFARAMACRAP